MMLGKRVILFSIDALVRSRLDAFSRLLAVRILSPRQVAQLTAQALALRLCAYVFFAICHLYIVSPTNIIDYGGAPAAILAQTNSIVIDFKFGTSNFNNISDHLTTRTNNIFDLGFIY